MTRSDWLTKAFYALYGDDKGITPERWKRLAVIQEVQEEASAQFDRWLEAIPPA